MSLARQQFILLRTVIRGDAHRVMIIVHELLVVRARAERQIVTGRHWVVIGVLLLVLIVLLPSSLVKLMIQTLLDLLVSQCQRQRQCLPKLGPILIEFLCVDLR